MAPYSPSMSLIILLIILLLFILLAILKNGFKGLETILEIFCRKKVKDTGKEVCCLHIPENLRPRPDPSIYCQKWLMDRGFGVTWNNPDFNLVEIATGLSAQSDSLKPNTDYRVMVTVHNLSTMAALNTKVSFEIKDFGIDGGTFATPSEVEVDIPAVGSATCFTVWHTPNNIGHICLVATLQHPDDANPMNNEGQHNTVIVDEQNNQKSVEFFMHNASKADNQYEFSYDQYSLPESPMRAKSTEERKSIGYLRKLQEQNRRVPLELAQTGFTITANAGQIERNIVTLGPGVTGKFTIAPNAGTAVKGKRLNIVATNPGTGKVIGGLTVIYK